MKKFLLWFFLQIKPEWLYELAPHFYEYGTVSLPAACRLLWSDICFFFFSRKENLQKQNEEEQMLASQCS